MKPFKVVCVKKANRNLKGVPIYNIILNEIYTVVDVENVNKELCGSGVLYRLKEADDRWFDSRMFRPADDTYGHVICEMIEEKIRYEEVLASGPRQTRKGEHE